MLPPERQATILARLAELGSVRTAELAGALDVTDETIRKDLESMEQRGERDAVEGQVGFGFQLRELEHRGQDVGGDRG